MKRKIWLDANRFVSCEIENEGKLDIYKPYKMCPELVDAMGSNGYFLKGVNVEHNEILVDRTLFLFNGGIYNLNQCSDLFEWFGESKVYEFTYYYNRIVFHHPDGRFYAAYIEDTDNYTKI